MPSIDDTLRRDGIVKPSIRLDRDVLAAVKEATDYIKRNVGLDEHGTFPDPDRRSPAYGAWEGYKAFGRILGQEDLTTLMRGYLGPRAAICGTQLVSKEPRSSEFGMHRDTDFFPAEPGKLLSVWIPLGPASRRNGALQFVRGSHRRRYAKADGTYRIAAEELENFDYEDGEFSIHDAALLHGSGVNYSDMDRDAFVLRWM